MFLHSEFVAEPMRRTQNERMGKRGVKGPKLSYAGALALARNLYPNEIRIEADFNRKIKIGSQTATNWKSRGIPKAEIWSIADSLKCSLDLVRAYIEPGHQLGEDVLTDDELLLVRGYRQADEQTRAVLLTTARLAAAAPPAEPQPHQAHRVVPMKKRHRN